MVYNQKLVAVIKNQGKILRETNGEVKLPFGSEYSIFLKNLNTKKALVKISIDGKDVLDGQELIIPANTELDLLGFMKGQKVSNKFKFIEKTDQISSFRGDRIDDGLIRITFRFEKTFLTVPTPTFVIYPSPTYHPYWHQDSPTWVSSSSCVYGAQSSPNIVAYRSPVNNDGITVKGDTVEQAFGAGYVGFLEETEHAIVLVLKGFVKNTVISKAITTKTKVPCETCGKNNKSNNRFCYNCGTALF